MFAMLLPVVAGGRHVRQLGPTRWWVIAWCAVLFVTDIGAIVARMAAGNNLWMQYVVTPLEDAMALYILSRWQRGDVARLTLRLAIPVFLIVWVALVIGLERTDDFSVFAHPFQALVMLAASLYTLARGTLEETGRVTQRDWFWISLGLSLFYAPGTALQPFAHAVYPVRPDLVRLAFYTKAALDVAAFFLIARGMLCPPTRAPSGGSSRQRLWPRVSSSSPSAPRW